MVRGFKLIDGSVALPGGQGPLWSIVDIRFGHRQDWPLELILKRGHERLGLTFQNIASFRAHDESEIIGHWAARAAEGAPLGTVYQIAESTYKDEFAESVAAFVAPLTHYLVAGHDLCVEVLAPAHPTISQAGS